MKMTALTPEYLEEIGRIIANFSLLEYEVIILIHGLLGTTADISRIVTCELSFKNLLDLSTSLINQIYEVNVVEEYKEILKTVTEAEDKRNLIIHSIWGNANEYVVRTKITAKRAKGLSYQHEKFTQEDLATVVQLISKAVLSVEVFRKQLGYNEWI